jgi:hypothetical protein
VEHRVPAREEEQSREVANILDNLAEEPNADDEAQTVEVGRWTIAVNDMTLADNEQVARGDHLFLGVHTIAHLTSGAQGLSG